MTTIHYRTMSLAIVTGTSGNDTINGGPGDDWIEAGDGNDTVNGGAGNDSIFGGAGADIISAKDGNDTIDGGIGNDELYADSPGVHIVRGGEGDDRLTGRDGSMTLDGGAGSDMIWYISQASPDIAPGAANLIGGDGNDQIFVQRDAATSSVTASGGAGTDTYLIQRASEAFTITDFAAGPGGDQFDIAQLLWSGVTANPFADPALLRLEQRGADTVMQFSHDGGVSAYRDIVILKDTNTTALTRENFVGGISPDGSTQGLDLIGTAAVDTLEGALLDDRIQGMAGNDQLWGHGGRDHLLGGEGDDFIVGGQGDDTLEGGDGNDQIEDAGGADVAYGGAGNDTIRLRAEYGFSGPTMYGGDGNDILRGGLGNERFHGGAGDDELRGSSGLDVALYDQPRAMYKAGRVDGVFTVKEPSGSTDKLFEMERIHFPDGALALDVKGVAGQVYRLYQAAFDRTPDRDGVGFWIGAADSGTDMTTISMNFMRSPEFASLYGAAPTNEALVRLFYANALHRPADEDGVAYWTDLLETGKATAAQVLYGFSESAENIAATAAVIANGIEYSPWP